MFPRSCGTCSQKIPSETVSKTVAWSANRRKRVQAEPCRTVRTIQMLSCTCDDSIFTKVNLLALEGVARLGASMGNKLESVVNNLVPAVCKNFASSNQQVGRRGRFPGQAVVGLSHCIPEMNPPPPAELTACVQPARSPPQQSGRRFRLSQQLRFSVFFRNSTVNTEGNPWGCWSTHVIDYSPSFSTPHVVDTAFSGPAACCLGRGGPRRPVRSHRPLPYRAASSLARSVRQRPPKGTEISVPHGIVLICTLGTATPNFTFIESGYFGRFQPSVLGETMK